MEIKSVQKVWLDAANHVPVHRKSVQENIDADHFFSQGHRTERKRPERGLIAVIANSTLPVRGERGQQMSGPGNYCIKGFQTK
jgi:hypothetical protein